MLRCRPALGLKNEDCFGLGLEGHAWPWLNTAGDGFDVDGGAEIAQLTMQEWTVMEEITGMDIAGVDNDWVLDSELEL